MGHIEARPEDRAQWVISFDTTPTYAGDVMHPEVVNYARDMARRAGATLVRRVPLEQVGEEVGVTRERVRQVETHVLRKLASLAASQDYRDAVSHKR